VPRIRPHVNPDKVEYLFPRVQRLELPAAREVEVEIGCAEAWFLFDRAASEPDREYVGLEIRSELIDPVNDKARALGAPVRSVFAHANIHFAQLFAPASLARVYLNFPDPWYKTRQQKRRVTTPALARDIASALRPGGELFFQSDVWDLALDAMAVLEQCPSLANAAGPWTFWKNGNPYRALSRREATCLEDGTPVWRLVYLRPEA
jgi:tRNA (guanine-N7-)-methyltransferase